MAKIPAPTERDHPLARFKAGGKPPAPPKPKKAKAKSKPKKRGKKK